MKALILLALLADADPAAPPASKCFAIRIVDKATGRGVPLVELTTTDASRFVTDNGGLVAFDEPGLMGTDVYFSIRSHGYEVAADGFGNRGVRLRPVPGGEATVPIKRINVAERLYRVTGGGLYRDSLLLGRPTPLRHPAINGLVVGQDSVVNGLCNGTLYWFWGDTNRPAYPLGNFHVPGAISKLRSQGGLDPDVGVDLDYFLDADGFARPTAKLPGEGPTWIFGVVVLPGPDGRERMLGSYVKVRDFLTVYEHGAVEFDEAKRVWVKKVTWPEGAPAYPGGQPTVVDGPGGRWVGLRDGFAQPAGPRRRRLVSRLNRIRGVHPAQTRLYHTASRGRARLQRPRRAGLEAKRAADDRRRPDPFARLGLAPCLARRRSSSATSRQADPSVRTGRA